MMSWTESHIPKMLRDFFCWLASQCWSWPMTTTCYLLRVHLVAFFDFWFLKNIFYFFWFLLLSKSKKVKSMFGNYVAIKQKVTFGDDRWRAWWGRRLREGREEVERWRVQKGRRIRALYFLVWCFRCGKVKKSRKISFGKQKIFALHMKQLFWFFLFTFHGVTKHYFLIFIF